MWHNFYETAIQPVMVEIKTSSSLMMVTDNEPESPYYNESRKAPKIQNVNYSLNTTIDLIY